MADRTQYEVGTRLVDMSLICGGGGFTFADSLVARAGGGQAAAVVVGKALNRFVTVATAADSVALPPAVGGQTITIINAGANALQLFASPGTSDLINATAGSTGISVAAGKTIEAVSFIGAWHTILSA